MGNQNSNDTFYYKAKQSSLKLKSLFSAVFKPHHKDDCEKILLAGTARDAGNNANMLNSWQKPWLFARILGFGLLLVGLLWLIMEYFPGYSDFFLVPIAFLGAFVVPFAVLFFYFELNVPRNISIYNVIGMALAGGILELLFNIILNPIIEKRGGAYLAPFAEEPAKLIALSLFLRKSKRRYILNGVLVGGAVGAGFSAFETMGYFVRSNIGVLLDRGLLSPGGHVLWAALYGGALAIVKGNQPLQSKHYFDSRFLKYFGVAMLLHMVWNMDFELLPIPLFIDVKYVILTSAGWMLLLHIILLGLQQVLVISGEGQPITISAGANVYLYGVKGFYAGKRIAIQSTIRIGRDGKTCSLVFPPSTPGVSRNHCTLVLRENHVVLYDNHSTAGTYLMDGTRLPSGHPVTLAAGSRFYLGNKGTTFEIQA